MKILHATDFSETADGALVQAERLAKALGAEIVLLHVVDTAVTVDLSGAAVARIFDAEEAYAEQEIAKRVAPIAAAGVPARGVVRIGTPVDEILKLADEERPDIIVLGTAGRGGVARLLLGSVAERVVRAATAPVMTVHRQAGAAERRPAA